jgi:hypothetical protein
MLEQLEARVLFAAADLSDWTGSNNTVSPNNYATSGLPAVTAGGTFQARRGSTAASLADPTIGSALGYNTSFSMSGSITFNSPTGSQIDPIWFLGFYNSTTNTHRVGLSAANANATTGDKLRFQTQSTNAAGTGTAQVDLASGGNEDIPDGTYSFNFTYSGTTHQMTATIGSFTATATYAYTGAADLNRFGFLQPANTANTATFTASITNINYTGETQVGGVPATPVISSATPGNGQVTLNWGDVATETGYTIEYATNSSFSPTSSTTAAQNATSKVIGSLTNGTLYYFRMKATNASGSSGWSPTATATPTSGGGGGTPAAPSGLTSSLPTTSPTVTPTRDVDLAWTDNATNETGYRVERATNSGFTGAVVGADLPPNVTSYKVTDLAPGTQYWFRVRAFNASGESGPSGSDTETTTAASANLPMAPGSLFVQETTGGSVKVNWTDHTTREISGANGFTLQRSTDPAFATSVTTISLSGRNTSGANSDRQADIVTGQSASTTYYYRIRANRNGGGGASVWSDVGKVTMLPPAGQSGTLRYISPTGVDSTAAGRGASASLPWKTMSYALQQVAGTAGDVTVYAMGGTYTTQENLISGSTIDPVGNVRFRPYQDQVPVFQFGGGPVHWWRVQDVTFEGLTFKGTVRIRQGINFDFIGNNFKPYPNENKVGGLTMFGMTNSDVISNDFARYQGSGLLFLSYDNDSGPVGWTYTEKRSLMTSYVNVINNSIDHLYEADGIHFETAHHVAIERNWIGAHSAILGADSGAHIDDMQLVEVHDSVVNANTMTTERGILVMGFQYPDIMNPRNPALESTPYPLHPATDADPNASNNNLVFTNNIHFGKNWGLNVKQNNVSAETDNLKVVNNTFWGLSTSDLGSGLVLRGGLTGATIVNNAIHRLNVDAATNISLSTRGNNVLGIAGFGTGTNANAAFNEVAGTPSFRESSSSTSEDDLRLTGGIGIDAGQLISVVDWQGKNVAAFDADGKKRPSSGSDIGAYERV